MRFYRLIRAQSRECTHETVPYPANPGFMDFTDFTDAAVRSIERLLLTDILNRTPIRTSESD
jgi:hypothetical protein